MREITAHFKAERFIAYVYVSAFFLALHYAFVIYINSTYLASLTSEKLIGFFYACGALINIATLLKMPKFLKKFGNWKLMLSLLLVQMLSLICLAFSKNIFLILPAFIAHIAIAPILYFNLDIFLSTTLKTETHTGGVRGIFLTLSNIAFVISPVLVGLLLSENNYSRIYLFSVCFLLPILALLIFKFRGFQDASYSHIQPKKTFYFFFSNKNISNIFIANFILQFFYVWMVIYMPIYLHQYVGFSWAAIGEMFSIMLLPFIIFQIPGGRLADSTLGEKDLLIIGLIIMGVATFIIPFLSGASFIAWTILLFLTRTGASIVEIMIETYFFKHVKGKDANLISMYRTAGPLAYIATPFVALILLSLIDIRYSFFFLALVVLYGLKFAAAIEDTKPNNRANE